MVFFIGYEGKLISISLLCCKLTSKNPPNDVVLLMKKKLISYARRRSSGEGVCALAGRVLCNRHCGFGVEAKKDYNEYADFLWTAAVE